eukprot:1161383-Pelagomonas_calceolata.AAC.8
MDLVNMLCVQLPYEDSDFHDGVQRQESKQADILLKHSAYISCKKSLRKPTDRVHQGKVP